MRHDGGEINHRHKEEETVNKITTMGLDLAKNVFHLMGFDGRGKEVRKKTLRRSQMLGYFTQLAPCLVGMEACASAHYWGRELTKLGHTVRLLPAQHVKPFVRGNKNDYNDARAIAEAMNRPGMRCVTIKTVAQQDAQALHRLRQGALDDRTALCNRLRGLLGEYGLVAPKGVSALRRRVPQLLEDPENGLSDFFRRLLAQDYRRFQELDTHIEAYTKELKAHSRQNEACQRLQTIPGFGPILASRFHSVVGDGQAYRRGRDVSAAVGVVPRQHSSGGKNVLLGISKRGDRHLRTLLIHGARSVVRSAANKDDRLSRWTNKIRAERGHNKAAVALANKMARIGWAVLHNNTVYQAA